MTAEQRGAANLIGTGKPGAGLLYRFRVRCAGLGLRWSFGAFALAAGRERDRIGDSVGLACMGAGQVLQKAGKGTTAQGTHS